MTVEISIDYESEPVRAIPVPATFVDVVLLNGPCELCGWSMRDTTATIPQDNSGSVTSPGANATITSLTGLAAGTYQVTWQVELSGTLAAADANNFALKHNGVIVLQSENLAVAGVYPQVTAEIVVAAGDSISITSIAAGTVGAVYTAQLSLQSGLTITSVAEFQDGNNPLGETSATPGALDTQWFGQRGLHVRNRINFHPVSGLLTGTIYARFTKNTG